MTHEKLSATDRAFLAIEEGALRMHVAAVMVFDGGGFVGPDGALNARELTARLAAGIERIPRFRQRVREVPGLGAVWEDDPDFRVDRHIVHAALPRPGDDDALMALAGRMLAEPLDRRHALWEICLVEGLRNGRFALLAKVHHAMVDGVAGLGVLAELFSSEPTDEALSAAPPHAIEAPARTDRLAASLLADGARSLLSMLRDAREEFVHPAEALQHAKELGEGLAETLRDGLTPAPKTSVNPDETSVRRTFLGVRFSMRRMNTARRELGVTVNEFVVAATASALRSYLARRGDQVDDMEGFRALVPVNLRPRRGESVSLGNRISLVLMPLPVALGDARERLEAVQRAAAHFKHESHEVEGAELVERIGDLGGPNVVSLVFRTAARLRAFNVVVSNVPGAPFPLYLGRSRLRSIWGEVPLFAHQGLSVVVMSYAGGLYLGLHADPDAVPDLKVFAADFKAAFDELCALAH